jgi:type I restriction enzyme R subunit
MRITGDNDEGKAQLDNFINPKKPYPVIATTSRADDHRRRCQDLQAHRAGPNHPVHDQVQADHRPWHPHRRQTTASSGSPSRLQEGHRAVRRSRFRRRAGARHGGQTGRHQQPDEGLGDIIDGADPLPTDEPGDNDDPFAPGVDEQPGTYTTGSDGGQSGVQGTGPLGGPEPGSASIMSTAWRSASSTSGCSTTMPMASW